MLVAIPLSHPEFARSTCIRPAAPLNGAASITVQIGQAVVRLADVASQCGWCVLPNSHSVFHPAPLPDPFGFSVAVGYALIIGYTLIARG